MSCKTVKIFAQMYLNSQHTSKEFKKALILHKMVFDPTQCSAWYLSCSTTFLKCKTLFDYVREW